MSKINTGIERVGIFLSFLFGIPFGLVLFGFSSLEDSCAYYYLGAISYIILGYSIVFLSLYSISVSINWVVNGFRNISLTKSHTKKIAFIFVFLGILPLSISIFGLKLQEHLQNWNDESFIESWLEDETPRYRLLPEGSASRIPLE